jgi:5'-3' exonuclease
MNYKMGIHRFFPWFKQRFSTNLKVIHTPMDVNTPIDNFMIDLNGVFHTSAQRVYKYGNFKQSKRLIPSTIKPVSLKNKDIEVFNDVCIEIERLMNFMKPQKRLILSVDGVAPTCKQAQQRQRRFKSAYESDTGEKPDFESCKISPGTVFMDELTKYINNFIANKMETDARWRQIEVIFSSEKVPSEGEQKCLQFVRQNKEINPTENYCIHGMDADLIMLALSAHANQFYVFRENIYESGFHLIDIKGVSTELIKLMKWNEDANAKKFYGERSIDDFVCLCFVIGNDFLPHIPSIEIVEGGVDVMLEVYRKVCESYGHLTRIQHGNIYLIKKTFEIFFSEISTYEKGMIEEKINGRTVFFSDPIVDRNVKLDPVTGMKVLNYESYREDYYNTLFPGVDIRSICLDYIEGMQWVITYYTRRVPCWNWFYKYNHAPLAKDLAKYFKDFRFTIYEDSQPNEPFQQLLSILSSKNHDLIPSPLDKLMTSKHSPLYNYYPESFDIDLSGKRKAWEGKAILPIIDQNLMKATYKSEIDKVNTQLMYLNKRGKALLYKVDSNHNVQCIELEDISNK